MRSAGWTAPGSSGCLAGRGSIRVVAITLYTTTSGATSRPPEYGPGSAVQIRPMPRASTAGRGSRPPLMCLVPVWVAASGWMPAAMSGCSVAWVWIRVAWRRNTTTSGSTAPLSVSGRGSAVRTSRMPRASMAPSTRVPPATARARACPPCRGKITPEISGYSGVSGTPRRAMSEI